MSARRLSSIVSVVLCMGVLVGCGAQAAVRQAQSEEPLSKNSKTSSEFSVDAMVPPSGWEGLAQAALSIPSDGGSADPSSHEAGAPALATAAAPITEQTSGSGGQAGQVPLIIKQGQIRLQVKNTDQAIDRLTQIVSDAHGYIISNRIWFEQVQTESYKFATYTIGVPVEAFEPALRRIRYLAIKVVDETASGQDVSEEYTDLQSRLGNLEATRDRIRTFLAQAQTVEESLRINNELSAIEDQIEQVEGRMRYLAGRAAYSTITVQFDPELPASPTPTPTPTPAIWDPGKTFERASGITVRVGQFLVDMFIYLAVWIPFAIPVVILWVLYRIITAKKKTTLP